MNPDEISGEMLTAVDPMVERVTTLLDLLGVLAVAAGVATGGWLLIGPWALVAGGVVLLGASRLAAAVARPAVEPVRHRRSRRDRSHLRLVADEAT